MKIAAKLTMTSLVTVLCLAATCERPAYAQAPTPAPGPTSTQVSASVKEALDAVPAPTPVSGQAAAVTPTPSPSSKDKASITVDSKAEEAEEDDLSLPSSSNKIPSSVKTVMKNLTETTDQVTLENLNEAREAVVKLDVLIDIEKRLNDLAKLRKVREDTSDLADAIPASALAAPPFGAPGASPMGMPSVPQPMAMQPASSSYDVVRVTGASGKFSAQVKDSGGLMKLVSVGDELSDGSKITAISMNGVTVLQNDKTRKTYKIKDAPAFFVKR